MLTDEEINIVLEKFRLIPQTDKHLCEDNDEYLFRFSKYILKYCEEKVMDSIEQENSRVLNNMRSSNV